VRGEHHGGTHEHRNRGDPLSEHVGSTRQRFVGLVVLRSYLPVAFTLTVVKIAEVAVK
jgi:hypothetical protein